MLRGWHSKVSLDLMFFTFCKLGLGPPYCRGYLEPPKLEGSALVVQNTTSLKEYATSSFTQDSVQVQLRLREWCRTL